MSGGVILKFARAAKLSGVQSVYEVARDELSAEQLGQLCRHLHRVDPDWKLAPKERRRLAGELLAAGVPGRRICAQLGIHRTTLYRIRKMLVNGANQAPQAASQSGESDAKTPGAPNGSHPGAAP